MSSASIPSLPSDDLNYRAIMSAVSDTMLEDRTGTRKKEKLEGHSVLSQKSTPERTAVERPAGIWIGRFSSISRFRLREALAAAAFFCSKKARVVSHGSVITSAECDAKAVRMRAWNSVLSRFSNFPLACLVGTAELALMAVWTICPSLPLICSRTDESDVLSNMMDRAGVGGWKGEVGLEMWRMECFVM